MWLTGFDAPSLHTMYVDKPIRMIVPSAPGGGTDIVARVIAQGLSEAWGQTVVVDNRGGAGGTAGVTVVAKASAADGYTLLLGSNGHLSFAPAVNRHLPYDPQKDLAPVSLVAAQPFVVGVYAGLPVASLKEFIAYAKSRPGTISLRLGRQWHGFTSRHRAVAAHGRLLDAACAL